MGEYTLPFKALQAVQVEVSSACNLSCPQCFRWLPGHVTGLMRQELWDDRIKPHLGQCANVHLVGIGEPLLHPGFLSFLADAVGAGAKTWTTSNLQLMTPEIADRLVVGGLYALSFSCDGLTSYESIRQGGTFARLEAALIMILEAKARHKVDTPALCLNFGASTKNIHELPLLVAWAGLHGVGDLIAFHNIAFDAVNQADSLYHHQAVSDFFFAAAAKLAQEKGVRFTFPSLFSCPIKYQPTGPYCPYPAYFLYVHSDGRVGPCCMDFPDRIVLGDLRESTLPEVWAGAPMLRLREELVTEPQYQCQHCANVLKMDISDERNLIHVD